MEETSYMEFMRRREELIKQGKSLSEATDRAYLDAYCSSEKSDQQSYKNR